MSRVALLLVLPIVFGCAKKDEPAADTAMSAAPTAAAPAPLNVAGKWTMQVMPADKDTTVLTYTLDATNETTGWKMTLPGRDAMNIRVIHMDNDSIVSENGPYSSALRKNVMVTTHSNMHMEGDKLVGTTIARYDTKGADSVVNLRTTGTRSQ
ncbi:MAG TPA: hypothetical protein VM053_02910 [Gemmatimonadaceae bacterium]|nr:hypothetical protein [Gemmatimonadaceae bacterium]